MKLKKISTICLIIMFITSTSFAQTKEKVLPEYGSNIIRFSPITAMDIGVGLSLSYERLLGADKMVGIVVPFSLILQNKNNFWDSPSTSTNYNSYFYFTPGIKIYPFGQRRVTYAIGPSMLMAIGGGKEEIGDNFGFTAIYDKTIFRLGVMVNNYINFQVTESFNLGMEVGLGIKYIDKETYKPSFNGAKTHNNGFDITGQFSMTLGYRF